MDILILLGHHFNKIKEKRGPEDERKKAINVTDDIVRTDRSNNYTIKSFCTLILTLVSYFVLLILTI